MTTPYVWAVQYTTGPDGTNAGFPGWVPADQFAAGLSNGTMQLAPNPGQIGGNTGIQPPAGGIALNPVVPNIQEGSLGLSGTLFQGTDGKYYKTDGTPATNVTPDMIPGLQAGANTRLQQNQAAQSSSWGSPEHLAGLAALTIGGLGAAGYLGGGASAAGDAASASTGTMGVDTGAVGGTGETAANLGGALSGPAVDPLTGLPASGIQSTINALGTSAGTGLPDLGTGLPMTPGMPGTSTGFSAIDNYLNNAGVNLANSGGPLVPGLGSANPMPELGMPGTPGLTTPNVPTTPSTSPSPPTTPTTTPSTTQPGTGGSSSSNGLGSLLGGLAAIGYANNLTNVDTSNSQNVYNNLGSLLGREQANAPLYVQAAQSPLLQSQAAGYGNMLQSQANRGIYGSSFGNNDIGNYMNLTNTGIANAGINAAQSALGMQNNTLGNQGLTANQIAQIQLGTQANKSNLIGRALGGMGNGLNSSAGSLGGSLGGLAGSAWSGLSGGLSGIYSGLFGS